MPYMYHPHVHNQRTKNENGKHVLVADTRVVLDCCDPRFSRPARETLEREQARVERRYGYDIVRLNQI